MTYSKYFSGKTQNFTAAKEGVTKIIKNYQNLEQSSKDSVSTFLQTLTTVMKNEKFSKILEQFLEAKSFDDFQTNLNNFENLLKEIGCPPKF